MRFHVPARHSSESRLCGSFCVPWSILCAKSQAVYSKSTTARRRGNALEPERCGRYSVATVMPDRRLLRCDTDKRNSTPGGSGKRSFRSLPMVPRLHKTIGKRSPNATDVRLKPPCRCHPDRRSQNPPPCLGLTQAAMAPAGCLPARGLACTMPRGCRRPGLGRWVLGERRGFWHEESI